MPERIYMDNNATTKMRPQVISAMTEVMAHIGNPSSVHKEGRDAARLIEYARQQVAALVGARARDVVFTSSGTEANNLALMGSGAHTIILSAIEHPSVLKVAEEGRRSAIIVPVNENGVIDLAALELALQSAEGPALVSVMYANNETGVIQPIKQVSGLAQQYKALVHCDAVQAAGRVFLDMEDLGINYLTLSSHKIGGPRGVGALVLSPSAPLTAQITGGGQELSRRSGTENVEGIVGFGRAAELAAHDIKPYETLAELRNKMEAAIQAFAKDAIVFGQEVERLPNTTNIAMAGVSGETQVMHMDLSGIAVSSGSACSSGKVKSSHVLEAMGANANAGCAIRISLGLENTEEDVNKLVAAWRSLYERTTIRKERV